MLLDLYTPEGEALCGTPWQVYPRPQMKRSSYLNLNGKWEFTASAKAPTEYDQTIQIPFCPESLLSLVQEHFPEGMPLWYRRYVTLPDSFHQGRVLLHVGAADQILECYVNREKVGSHTGGYEAMTFDITDYLKDENEIVFKVTDDLRSNVLPYGKQVMERGGMWYTPISGIWQTVWMESVPLNYIAHLDIRCEGKQVVVSTGNEKDTGVVTVKTPEGIQTLFLEKGTVTIAPPNPRLWRPEDPYLYEFTVEIGRDKVESYFALRTLEIKEIDEIPRLLLNGKPYFFHGLLDQGYWSDGLYTPAAPECYARDIEDMKNLGFNTLRKHIKVEPEEFYYQCDKLGMIVWQDMVNNGDYAYIRDTVLPTIGLQKWPDKNMHKDEAARKAFMDGMKATVNQLKNHPCIVYWTIFNEGWGQFAGSDAYQMLKEMDDTRFIDTTSGWFRVCETDVDSRHIYFGPWWQLRTSDKPLILSEFGGYCYAEPDHIANPDKSYGYKAIDDKEALLSELLALYAQRIEPAIEIGLCGAIYTQVSDVEDEINGLLTYDRRIVKIPAEPMQQLAKRLQAAIRGETQRTEIDISL